MGRKVQVKACWFDAECVVLLFDGGNEAQGLEPKKQRAVQRLLSELESNPRYRRGWRNDLGAGRPFDFKHMKDGLFAKIRREDRKSLFDVFCEGPMDKKPSITMIRKARKIAAGLGMKRIFEDIKLVQDLDGAVTEDVEEELIEEWGDEDEEVVDAKPGGDPEPPE